MSASNDRKSAQNDIHKDHRDKMKNRYRECEFVGFSPHEIIEVLLFFTLPQSDVNPLAHLLYDSFGRSFANVFNATRSELLRINGVGEHVSDFFTLLPEVFRYCTPCAAHKQVNLLDIRVAAEYMKGRFTSARSDDITLTVALLDAYGTLVSAHDFIGAEIDDEVGLCKTLGGQISRSGARSYMLAWNDRRGEVDFDKKCKYLTELIRKSLSLTSTFMRQCYIFEQDECQVSVKYW